MILRILFDAPKLTRNLWPQPLAIVVTLLLLLPGCGKRTTDYSSLNLATVTGKITLNKEPLVGASVIFEGDAGRFAYGTTDKFGRYELMFNSEQAGVQAGKKKVRISMTGEGENAGEEVDPDGEEPDGEETTTDVEVDAPISIPTRYNSASILMETVEAGKSQQFDFDLESP